MIKKIHFNVRVGDVMAQGNTRFYVTDIRTGSDGATILRGTLDEMAFYAVIRGESDPSCSWIYRGNEKVDVVTHIYI